MQMIQRVVLLAAVTAASSCATARNGGARGEGTSGATEGAAGAPTASSNSTARPDWTSEFSAAEHRASLSLLSGEVWKNDHDQPVRMSAVAPPLFVAAVYTDCIHVCPKVVADLLTVDQYFRARSKPIQIALVSLNPDTDNAERLQMFRRERKLPENWVLLRGTADQTASLADLLDMHTLRMDEHIYHESNVAVFAGGNGAPAQPQGSAKLLVRGQPTALVSRLGELERALFP